MHPRVTAEVTTPLIGPCTSDQADRLPAAARLEKSCFGKSILLAKTPKVWFTFQKGDGCGVML
jgi:hypothetical protein